MAKSFNITLELPQPTVKVSVGFYDDEEKQKLLKYPTHAVMENLVKSGLEIPTEEFLTYYLFHKKRPGKEGWRNYREVGRKIGHALAELSEWVDFNGHSLSTPCDIAGQDRSITERIGESIGLSVVSNIHGLTAADWDRISIGRYSSFDYQIASDGKLVVQMEAKGSAAEDNSTKTSSVSQHKRSIADKKKAIAEREKQNDYPYPADLRYGTITVMGESVDDPVKCLLVEMQAYASLELALGERFSYPKHERRTKQGVKQMPWMLRELFRRAVKEELIVPEKLPVWERIKGRRKWHEENSLLPLGREMSAIEWLDKLVENIPVLRNTLAHGKPRLDLFGSLWQLELCADLINALFLKIPTT